MAVRNLSELEESLKQRQLLKDMVKMAKDKDLAIEIKIGEDKSYWVGNNAFVKHLLRKELNEVNKFIKGKKNKWE